MFSTNAENTGHAQYTKGSEAAFCAVVLFFQGHVLVSNRNPGISGFLKIIGCEGGIHITAPQETKCNHVHKLYSHYQCADNDKGLSQSSGSVK